MNHGKKTLLCVLGRFAGNFGNGNLGKIVTDGFMETWTDLTRFVLDVAFGGNKHTRHTSIGHGGFDHIVSRKPEFMGRIYLLGIGARKDHWALVHVTHSMQPGRRRRFPCQRRRRDKIHRQLQAEEPHL